MWKNTTQTGLRDRRNYCGENRYATMNLGRCASESEAASNGGDDTNEFEHRRSLQR